MLEGNRRRVQNLTGTEIWLFIIGRVLVAFGVGILAMIYFPALAANLAWPALIAGSVALLIAFRGLYRRRPIEPLK
jgi:hypothetical protein